MALSFNTVNGHLNGRYIFALGLWQPGRCPACGESNLPQAQNLREASALLRLFFLHSRQRG